MRNTITIADSAMIDYVLAEAKRYERVADTIATHPAYTSDERQDGLVKRYRAKRDAMYELADNIQQGEHKAYAKEQKAARARRQAIGIDL